MNAERERIPRSRRGLPNDSDFPWNRQNDRIPRGWAYVQPWSRGTLLAGCAYPVNLIYSLHDEILDFRTYGGAMLTVDITSLTPGTHRVDFAPSAAESDLDPGTFADIHVDVQLQYHRDRILVRLRVEATAELTCDRTLKEYEQPVTGEYSLLFGPPSMVGQEGEAFEEVRPLASTDREIDLTDVVRDTLLLALPQRRIAPDARDEPIEETFGSPEEDEDTPVDPRWSKLEALSEEGPSGS